MFQGAVESIAMKNPKERTALFEEISGYVCTVMYLFNESLWELFSLYKFEVFIQWMMCNILSRNFHHPVRANVYNCYELISFPK